jgi:regulator of replication initiation timing
LEAQRLANEEKVEVQNRIFDSIKQLESEKAKLDDEVRDLKVHIAEIEQENTNLHMVAQETNSVLDEKVQLASILAQLEAENESLIKENEYYKDDLVPTMRAKNQEMQKKFREFDAERKELIDQNKTMKSFKTDSEQLLKEQQAHHNALTKCEALNT